MIPAILILLPLSGYVLYGPMGALTYAVLALIIVAAVK